MAYRANLFDFGAIEGSAGGANAAANDAAFAAAIASPIQNIEIEPGIFEVSQTITNNKHSKALLGTGRADVFATAPDGVTCVDWWGAEGGTVAAIASTTAGQDVHGAKFSGMSFNGRNIANVCLADKATRRSQYGDIQVLNPKVVGMHFVKLPAGQGNINVSYRPTVRNLSACVNGGANGMIFDGITFGSIYDYHCTHMNGMGIYMRDCDDVHLWNAGTSRGPGGTGISVMFDGAQGEPVLGNAIWGLHCCAHDGDVRIWSRGPLARGNDILFLSGVDNKDNQPIITVENGSELYWNFTGRSIYPPTVPTLSLEKGLRRMPKRQELTW